MALPAFLLKVGAEQPLIEELWEYFVDTYVNGEAVYENLDMGGLFSVQTLVIGVFLGLAIAAIASVVNKQINGAFVTTLLESKCHSPESAKTLPELDSAHLLLVRWGLCRGVNLRRVVRCREEEEYIAECRKKEEEYAKMRETNPKLPKSFTPPAFRVLPDAHHFYIPDDLKFTAETKFDRRGNSIIGVVVFSVIIFIAFIAVMVFLPQLMSLVDQLVGMLK